MVFFLLNYYLSNFYLAIPNNHYTTVNSYQQNYDNTHSIAEHNRAESIDSFKTDEQGSKGRIIFITHYNLNRFVDRTFY